MGILFKLLAFPVTGPVDGLMAILRTIHEEVENEMQNPAVAHDTCISQLMEQTTILPAPFASLLPNESALRQLMQQQEQRWQALLEDVSGCVEMGLRAFVNHPQLLAEVAQPISARAGYLRRKSNKR